MVDHIRRPASSTRYVRSESKDWRLAVRVIEQPDDANKQRNDENERKVCVTGLEQ